MADPAADFAALLHARLAGRQPAAVPDVPAMPATPRLPAPNLSQGSSGLATPPQPRPADAFARLFDYLGAPVGDGGWRTL